jgi:uncharacterized membrane-anchored protein
MTTQLRFGLFVLLALLQLSFPGKLVFDSNKVLWMGTELKFETRPVDPADPFRGRYVALNFAANQFEKKAADSWKRNDRVFVLLDRDAQGFARSKGLSAVRPAANELFVKARITYLYDNQITVYYPFSKFFMEESKAPEAERIYREAGEGYALVKVYQGEAVLQDVVVKGKSLNELAK